MMPVAQPQKLINGPINVFPGLIKEYSTAMDFDLVTRLAINPADSRLRTFFVSMRWDTLPRRRRNWPWRWGPVKGGQDLDGPLADENRGDPFRLGSWLLLHFLL